MIHWLFTNRLGTRDWPMWAHFAATTAIIAVTAMIKLGLTPILGGQPFLLFYPAIVLCAVLFDYRSGVLAVVLSALAATLLLLPPIGSLRIESGEVALALSLFVLVGLPTAILVEELHRALRRATAANKKLAAAEEEKDLLLREAIHRFRNDLSMICASAHAGAQHRGPQSSRSAQNLVRQIGRNGARSRAAKANGWS